MKMKRKSLSSILGLSIEDGQLTAAVVRKAGRGFRLAQSLQAPLTLDLMTNDSELVGREIRDLLAKAGIRESRCIVCAPLNWVLSLRTEVPELSEKDAASFFSVKAEREFPFGPEDLSISISQFQSPSGRNEALVAAIPRHHLNRLLAALKAARLQPVGITLGVTALLPAESAPSEGVVTLLVGDAGIDLIASVGRGTAALRALKEVTDPEAEGNLIDPQEVARQIRITLGQLPEDMQEAMGTIRFFGRQEQVERLLPEMSRSVQSLKLSVEAGKPPTAIQASPETVANFPPGVPAAAADRLGSHAAPFEFLPPRVSRFRQITGRISSRGTRWLAAAAAVLVLGVTAILLHQHFRLARLESAWSAIEPRVVEVETVQANIRRYRDWFDDSAPNLVILRRLTEAFPEPGTVWADSLTIRRPPDSAPPIISCSGRARSNREWLEMLQRLGNTKGVEPQFEQVRGEDPLEFTLHLQWNEGEADGI
jgi:hypothetical protein